MIWKRFWDLVAASIPILLLSTSAFAQTHADIVANVKNEMGPAAFVSNEAMLGFVLRVLDHLPPAEQLGLVKAPPGGENVALYQGQPVRVNRVIQPNGQIIKILTDSGPGGANGPAWNLDDVRADLYLRYLPNVVLPPPSVPVPVPVPAPSVDYSALLERIIALQESHALKLDESLIVAKDTNAHVVSMDRTLTQTLGSISVFLGKYVAPAIGGYFIAKQIGQPAAVVVK